MSAPIYLPANLVPGERPSGCLEWRPGARGFCNQPLCAACDPARREAYAAGMRRLYQIAHNERRRTVAGLRRPRRRPEPATGGVPGWLERSPGRPETTRGGSRG